MHIPWRDQTLDCRRQIEEVELQHDVLSQLMDTILDRKAQSSGDSYTNKLLSAGRTKISKKILEEAREVAEAAELFEEKPAVPLSEEDRNAGKVAGKVEGTKDHIVYEAGDLIYHLWVLLAHYDIPLEELKNELARRFGQSGLQEKASRNPTTEDK